MSEGFGMYPLKAEGAPCHPDYMGVGSGADISHLSDEWYLKQLQAYSDFHGIEEAKQVGCTRPELLGRLT